MVRMSPTLVLLTLTVALVGCRKSPTAPPPPAARSVTMATPTEAGVPGEVIDQMVENFQRVHFELDSSDLDESSKAALSDNARILQSHRSVTVEIQGHADERGTTDYNLALGQRRADAVQKQLSLMGVKPERLVVVSFGEERPAVAGQGEVAWTQNRRAEFRILVGSGVVGTTDR